MYSVFHNTLQPHFAVLQILICNTANFNQTLMIEYHKSLLPLFSMRETQFRSQKERAWVRVDIKYLISYLAPLALD